MEPQPFTLRLSKGERSRMRDEEVLLCVLKSARDLEMLLRNKVYRIPMAHAPKKKARFLAFYEPGSGKQGHIRYYAQVLERTVHPRVQIISGEPNHPRARQNYLAIRVGEPLRLKRPILNLRRMRITFGFTNMEKLLSSREVKELFSIPPIEEIIQRLLDKMEVKYIREHPVSTQEGKSYRLDFALFPDASGSSPIALECDGNRSHSGQSQIQKDRKKDRDLEELGWVVLRLKEQEILNNPAECRQNINKLYNR